jgi:hypothetical protein
MHVRDYQATTASMVAELRAGAPPRVWACLGSPCVGVYVPVFPPHVPAALADAATWSRFERLRDRVEADPSTDALVEIRAALGPVEADLWADADAIDASGERTAQVAFSDRAFAPVADALGRLGV